MELSKVLFVDDDPNILQSFNRRLRLRYDLSTAIGSREALKLIETAGPFAVVVSDMRMPGMNGVEFLQAVKERSETTVRIMLTGNIDQTTAVNAVNDGQVFQFLNKPCSPDEIADAIDQALEHYRLVTAEKDLLQNTLAGSVKVLTDILEMADPVTFGNIAKRRITVKRCVPSLGVNSIWEIDLATMLCEIGRVALPVSVAEKIRQGVALDDLEQAMIDQIPETGKQLLMNIPRMERVAEIVSYSRKNFDGTGVPRDAISGKAIPVEARIIRIIADFETLQEHDQTATESFRQMKERVGFYDPELLKGFSNLILASPITAIKRTSAKYEVEIDELFVGQRLLAPVLTKGNLLLFSSGAVLTPLMITRIKNHQRQRGIRTPLVVDRIEEDGELV